MSAGIDLANLRHRSGMSQAEFARVYGIPLRSLRDWETGMRNPSGAALSLLRAIEREPAIMAELLGNV